MSGWFAGCLGRVSGCFAGCLGRVSGRVAGRLGRVSGWFVRRLGHATACFARRRVQVPECLGRASKHFRGRVGRVPICFAARRNRAFWLLAGIWAWYLTRAWADVNASLCVWARRLLVLRSVWIARRAASDGHQAFARCRPACASLCSIWTFARCLSAASAGQLRDQSVRARLMRLSISNISMRIVASCARDIRAPRQCFDPSGGSAQRTREPLFERGNVPTCHQAVVLEWPRFSRWF